MLRHPGSWHQCCLLWTDTTLNQTMFDFWIYSSWFAWKRQIMSPGLGNIQSQIMAEITVLQQWKVQGRSIVAVITSAGTLDAYIFMLSLWLWAETGYCAIVLLGCGCAYTVAYIFELSIGAWLWGWCHHELVLQSLYCCITGIHDLYIKRLQWPYVWEASKKIPRPMHTWKNVNVFLRHHFAFPSRSFWAS